MDALQLFLYCHDRMHTGIEQILTGLSDEQIRLRPSPRVNSLAWLLWHLVRTEDISANRIIADRPQVLHADEWLQRLNLSRHDVGTGMNDEEVSDYGARIDLAGLREYWQAVRQRTREVAQALPPEAWDAPVETAHLKRVVFDEEMFTGGYRPAEAAFAPRPKGTWFGSHVLVHGLRHQGEMSLVRGLLG